jgi:hypothetical protein
MSIQGISIAVIIRGYKSPKQSMIDNMWDDCDVCRDINELISSDVAGGDLQRPSSWGVVKRDGQELPVLVDYGHEHRNY